MRAIADVDGDGSKDIFATVDYESGASIGLYWYKSPSWIRYTIAENINFRGDDLSVGDIDGDGDIDLVVSVDNNGKVYWYENPGPVASLANTAWTPHYVGQCRGYVKETEVADLNLDGKLEIVIRTKKSVTVFANETYSFWSEKRIDIHPREGLDVGDLDKDGDLDLVLNGFWLETPDDLINGNWVEHDFDPKWYSQSTGHWQDNSANVVVVDINSDGNLDILICNSEKADWPITWYQSDDPKNGPWIPHDVIEKFDYCETLAAADMDNDGDLDIVAGEMKKSILTGDLVVLDNIGGGLRWQKTTIAGRIGIYHGVIGDIDADGDMDIIGCRDYNKAPIDWWENLTSDKKRWKYTSIDKSRPEDQFGKMGLIFTDINHDDYPDVVAGSYIYLNPKNYLANPWQRIQLPENVDIYFSVDVDGDQLSDLIGIGNNKIYWLEELNEEGSLWRPIVVGTVPEGRTQGHTQADLIMGGKPELVFTRGKSLYYLKIPVSKPENTTWEMVEISSENEEEGISAGDIDRDGDLDVAAVSSDGHHIIWLENPELKVVQNAVNQEEYILPAGNVQPIDETGKNWLIHVIGVSTRWSDRIALADINNDGKLDIVSTEESRDLIDNSSIYWFDANDVNPYTGEWRRHTVDTLRSVNSLDVADIDKDGDLDLVIGEHTDQRVEKGAIDNLTLLYMNENNGEKFSPRVVERGEHSSHLGTQFCDLDKDGDLDIVSICWKQYKHVHLWENLSPIQK